MQKNVVRLPYAGESIRPSSIAVKLAGSAASRSFDFCCALSVGRSNSGVLSEYGSDVGRGKGFATGCRGAPMPMLAMHQSMKGLPWCGVEMLMSETGVYSFGRMCEMR